MANSLLTLAFDRENEACKLGFIYKHKLTSPHAATAVQHPQAEKHNPILIKRIFTKSYLEQAKATESIQIKAIDRKS